jgi:hypothetical protein
MLIGSYLIVAVLTIIVLAVAILAGVACLATG